VDWFQFISSLVQSVASLAWPAAFVVAAWLFREKLVELLPHLTVKHKDWEASFRLEKAEAEAAALPPAAAPTPEQQPTPEEKSRFEQLAELSPRAAILEARSELSQVVEEMATHLGALPIKPRSLLEGIRALRNSKMIDPTTSALLNDLRVVGNEAAHNPDVGVTKEEAMRFRALTDTVLRQLTQAMLVGPH
jgi:hypothetical protein